MMDSFNVLIGALKDAEIQTGYPKHGRVVGGKNKDENPKQSLPASPPNLRMIVNRLRWGLPLMRYT